MKKNYLKLINDERMLTSIKSQKGCTGGAQDNCVAGNDFAHCSGGSTTIDICYILDYGVCVNGANDTCNKDY